MKSPIATLAAALVITGGGLLSAQESVVSITTVRSEENTVRPSFVALDEFIGADVRCMKDGKCEISDAILVPESGEVRAVILDNGMVVPFAALSWSDESGCFDLNTENARRMEHSSESMSGPCVLASHIDDLPLVGIEHTENGRQDVEIGSVGGAFIDRRSGHLAYVTTSVGGILGIGSESRVIPWSAVEVERCEEGEPCLKTDLTAGRLERAPAYGTDAKNLNNPEYRDSLYSFYGAERADFEPAGEATLHLVTVNRMIGDPLYHDGDEKTRLSEVMIDPMTGAVLYVQAEDGCIFPTSELSWNHERDAWQTKGRALAMKDVEAKGCVMASKVLSAECCCENERIGRVADLYFDRKSNEIRYASIDNDDVVVLPWSVVMLRRVPTENSVDLDLSTKDLESAPKLDGTMGSTMHSPAFREKAERLRKENRRLVTPVERKDCDDEKKMN